VTVDIHPLTQECDGGHPPIDKQYVFVKNREHIENDMHLRNDQCPGLEKPLSVWMTLPTTTAFPAVYAAPFSVARTSTVVDLSNIGETG
jgi:hypothetical protein